MVTNDLTELDLRDEQQQVSVKRGGSNSVPVVTQAPMAVAPAAAGAVAPAASVAIPEAAASDDGLIAIESPMVGTYYAKPSPDKPSFLNVGDAIGEESVVCLIEAMKIFNEIKAEQTGTVAKILVQNGDAVEFGQPLILIKPE